MKAMSLLQGERTKSRNPTRLSFSARNSLSVKTQGVFLSITTKGGIEQLEDIEKPDISKRPLHHCCSSHFLYASAKVLRE